MTAASAALCGDAPVGTPILKVVRLAGGLGRAAVAPAVGAVAGASKIDFAGARGDGAGEGEREGELAAGTGGGRTAAA